MNSDKLIQLYSKVCGCDSQKCRSYSEVYNCPSKGSPPRGFYAESTDHKKVLVVGKNPGHALDAETELYLNLQGADLVKAHWSFSWRTFFKLNEFSQQELPSTRFHSNLISYLTEIIDCEPREVFWYVAYTNLVKCSTLNEQAILSRRTINECFNNHLINEINFFKPTLIFALGREVERFLKTTLESLDYSIEIAYIKHPSYFYSKKIRNEKLRELKEKYFQHVTNL
jgi:uracil-DNA glycosylase